MFRVTITVYKLLGQDETVEGVGKFMGRKRLDGSRFAGMGISKIITENGSILLRFDGYIRTAALKYDVDPSQVKAVVQVESNFDPDAISRAGARSLMQLMPGTAAQYSLGMQQINNPQKY